MGQFSWITSDTKRAIRSTPGKTFPVWMIMPDKKVLEEDYNGYGDFGGLDYYVEVWRLNGAPKRCKSTQEKRCYGIEMSHSYLDGEGPKCILPRFAEDGNIPWDELEESAHDPNQGWGEGDDDDQ